MSNKATVEWIYFDGVESNVYTHEMNEQQVKELEEREDGDVVKIINVHWHQ